MHVVHGVWIPREPAEFVQDGTFYLWVENDAPIHPSRRNSDSDLHPRHLKGDALIEFVQQKLDNPSPYTSVRSLETISLLLPTGEKAPLPSTEILPYLDEDLPEMWEFRHWRVQAFPLGDVIRSLNDIHFSALQGAEDFQLGADFLFWWQYSQELKRLIAADAYIPALAYRELPAKKGGAQFEVYPGWELCSPQYEETVRRYAACMPAACAAGSVTRGDTDLYAPHTLLRHFSEYTLHRAVVSTPSTTKLDNALTGTPLYDCFHEGKPVLGSDFTQEIYRGWLNWRTALTASQREDGFMLCFRLEEAPTEDPDNWTLHFLMASRRDPSYKVPLAEYWSFGEEERKALTRHMRQQLERGLLLALGHAARVYPRVWDGLETDRPSCLHLTLAETYAFLKEGAWVLEDAGFTVIVPSWWTREGRRRARVRLSTSGKSGSTSATTYFSLDTIVDYQYQLSIDGQTVTAEEWRQLVEAKTSLVQFRGQWMELDRERIRDLLAEWEERQREMPEMSILDLMKIAADDDLEIAQGDPLQEVLAALEEKSSPEWVDDPANFHGALRDYQKRGVAWLRYLERLSLNPCLADDMGLGKTVQVIAQLVAERNENGAVPPTLLIAPTSVLGNWRKEIERFAPHLRVISHHGAGRQREAAEFKAAARESDVVITSFALARLDEKLLRSCQWRRIVVDEAQNIKNPQAAQTRAITKLPARHRLALTGTPVENRLRDLWSIFNFLNPGYLGKEAQFRKAFEIPIQRNNDAARSSHLKRLVEPLILRRLKTDRQIIQDLPDKIEGNVYCNLTPEQASLYEAVVRDVEEQLENAEGMQRRGLILATLLKLKQVCNHPSQFLHDGSTFSSERSHKLERLLEMVDEVIDNGESVLIFTQFTEVGEALERTFKRQRAADLGAYNTFYLHGGTSAAKREKMVEEFQNSDADPAVFILSVRAGGIGLNLTRANHVFHFDRWWNPAVEDQATDRAFRIGQHRNVFVHKFVTLGTVEERIDAMIQSKRGIAASIVGNDEGWLTELDNETFKDLVALRRTALVE